MTSQDEKATALIKPQSLLVAAIVGVLCFTTALLEFSLVDPGNLALPFWAANAIALTALLRSPRSAWPAILVAFAAGLAAADLLANRTSALSAVYVLANVCETVVAAMLLRRGGQPFELAERKDVMRFILVCGVLAPMVSAAIASLASTVRPGGFALSKALSWYVANAMGLIIFTPALWLSEGAHRAIAGDRRRLAVFVALILVMGPIWMATAYFPMSSAAFLTLPILGYLALEYGVAGIALGVLGSALYAFGAGLLTQYIHTTHEPLANLLFKVEVFVAGVAAFGLPLGVIVDDKKRIQDALINCLTGGVGAGAPAFSLRPEDSLITAGLLDADGLFRLIARDGEPDPAVEALDGRSLFDVMTPRDRRALKAAFENAIGHHNLRDATRRLHARLNLDGRPVVVTLTLLSVRRGVAGERSEAMVLVETTGRRPSPHAEAA